jgi:hypothetical protein
MNGARPVLDKRISSPKIKNKRMIGMSHHFLLLLRKLHNSAKKFPWELAAAFSNSLGGFLLTDNCRIDVS